MTERTGPIDWARQQNTERERAVCCGCQGAHGPVVYRNFLEQPLCAHCCECSCGTHPCTAPQPEQPARHTVDTITSDALDALYELLDAAQETELARQLATSDRAFYSAHLRATRLGGALARAQRALASTVLQARRQAARAEQAEAAIARVRALHHPTTAYGRPTLICAECSAADSKDTTDNSPVNHPCSTLAALDPQEPTP